VAVLLFELVPVQVVARRRIAIQARGERRSGGQAGHLPCGDPGECPVVHARDRRRLVRIRAARHDGCGDEGRGMVSARRQERGADGDEAPRGGLRLVREDLRPLHVRQGRRFGVRVVGPGRIRRNGAPPVLARRLRGDERHRDARARGGARLVRRRSEDSLLGGLRAVGGDDDVHHSAGLRVGRERHGGERDLEELSQCARVGGRLGGHPGVASGVQRD